MPFDFKRGEVVAIPFADVADVIGIVVGALVSLIGLYLANSYARQTRTQLADARRSAYAGLWEITGLAAPTRLETAGRAGALSKQERDRLYQLMTDWYYRNGNGMLLAEPTRTVYLTTKANLVCADADVAPKGILQLLPSDMSVENRRGCMSIRQLSLLRTQMKADLAIFGVPYVGRLSEHERAFLKHCKVSRWSRAWRSVMFNGSKPEGCGQQDETATG